MRNRFTKIAVSLLLVVLFCSSAYAASFKETQKKALKGDADAQYELGEMYHDGKGVKQSYTEGKAELYRGSQVVS